MLGLFPLRKELENKELKEFPPKSKWINWSLTQMKSLMFNQSSKYNLLSLVSLRLCSPFPPSLQFLSEHSSQGAKAHRQKPWAWEVYENRIYILKPGGQKEEHVIKESRRCNVSTDWTVGDSVLKNYPGLHQQGQFPFAS